MRNDGYDTEIDRIIREAIELTDKPGADLNGKIKASLYEKERLMRKEPAARVLSVWYLPMILNLVIFLMLAIVSFMMISNTYLSYLATGICLYIGLAGILLTAVGVKRTNMKENITICIEKRGELA